MFSALTYFFYHSIYFARLHHVNPLCKRQYAFLQMKESPNQKVQEKKPLLKFKNTKKYMCLERIWRKKCFRACRHRPLLAIDHTAVYFCLCNRVFAFIASSLKKRVYCCNMTSSGSQRLGTPSMWTRHKVSHVSQIQIQI